MPRARSTVQQLKALSVSDGLPGPVHFRWAQVPADSSYPQHSHQWGEFVYAYSGVMEVKVAEHHYLAPPQYGLWLPAQTEHRGLNREAASHCSLYLAPELAADLPERVCALSVSPLLRALLEQLRQQPPSVPPSAVQARLLQVVVDQLQAAKVVGSYLPSSDDPVLSPVLQALLTDPGNEQTLAQWADFAHTTERTLMRRCQAELGMPLAEWRQRLRVVKAMPRLEAGERVAHLAQELGYASTSAFIAMFRRLMGTTPDAHRRQVLGRPQQAKRRLKS